jgi:hypothetical protein
MRNATFVLALAAAYFVGWTGSYILFWVLRGDTIPFNYYFDYLFAAWTFGGIEGASQFMLIGSIVLLSL